MTITNGHAHPSHSGGFITDIYLEPNGISGLKLAELKKDRENSFEEIVLAIEAVACWTSCNTPIPISIPTSQSLSWRLRAMFTWCRAACCIPTKRPSRGPGASVAVGFQRRAGEAVLHQSLRPGAGQKSAGRVFGCSGQRWLAGLPLAGKRKAVGLSESLNPASQAFGREVMALWDDVRATVVEARQGAPCSIRPGWEAKLQVS